MGYDQLIIEGYAKDISVEGFSGKIGQTFSASINPENISLTKSISLNDKNTTNASGKDVSQDQGSDLDQLGFDLILDGTGIIDGKTVKGQVDHLDRICCQIDGGSHKPPFIFVAFGDLQFIGRTEQMSVEYSLFDSNGNALRAKVSLKFKEHKAPTADAADNATNSPDMSHMKVIQEGDSLPSMCENIYGDIKYYIAIARINKLTNFREIKVGTELLFPPLV